MESKLPASSDAARWSDRGNALRVAGLIAVVLAVSAAHYLTPIGGHDGHEHHASHAVYQWFYHLPIILAAFWYGLRGGMAMSGFVSALYIPHLVLQWHGGTTEQWLEVALFNIVGCVVGLLSGRQKLDRDRYRRAAGELDRAYAELKERTELLLKTEEQLRRADRLTALGQLSAGLAHEVKTPLSSIRGSAEILARSPARSTEDREFLDILVREVDRLNRVVNRFLDFARPKPEVPQVSDPNRAARDVADLLAAEAGRQGIAVQTGFEPHLPEVGIDGEQLRQVLLNLAMNAIQAMGRGGTLTIRSALAAEGRVRLIIADTGPGIPEHLLPRVFDPFVTGRPGGTGLGLSIVHRILANHGAEIRLSSVSGEGTRAEILLPVPAVPSA